jgi:hypothetical protein
VGSASAQPTGPDVVPGATREIARNTARGVMTALVAGLRPEDKRRLVGVYVAFDESLTDVSALAACDDDGDYVVTVSDGLLGLLGTVSEARATDETFGTHKQADYAALVSTSQPGHVRLLPPPAGFFDASQARAPAKVALTAARFREGVGEVIAHELTRLVDGDLVCPNPTATHEHGDDLWTREERDHALAVARKLYAPLRTLSADGAATARLLDAGMTEQGGLAWLSFLERLERPPGDATWTYLELHHDPAVRVEVVRAAADQWRKIHAAAGPAKDPRTLSPPMTGDR